ncbi:MAG: tetratricopeptide repeat protein [Candidatus Omnitrophica bacterium]|nr:tetratricopeptide repeat protein [Candidatus Omnitrophota bacterium]
MKLSFKNTKIVYVLFILFFCLLAYANSFRNVNFLIDDWDSIVDNARLSQPKYLFYEFFPIVDSSAALQPYYRPLISVVLAVSYWICGFNVLGYHILNFMFLCLACLSIYIFIEKYFENSSMAVMTAIFCAIHPFNSYIVNNASAGFSALKLAVLCWAAIFFKSFHDHPARKVYLVVSVSLYTLALLFHDNALTFPLFLLALSSACLKNNSLSRLFLRMSPYVIVSVILYLIKEYCSGDMVNIFDHEAVSIWQYGASVTKLMAWYVEKLFTGVDVVFIWATHTVVTHLAWWNILLLLVILVCVRICFLKKIVSVVRFAAGSFLLSVFSVAGACRFEPAHGWIIEPSWLSFAAIAFFAGISFTLLKIREIFPKFIFVLIFSAYVGTLLFNSWALNQVWATEERYCMFWAKQVPGFTTPLSYLASHYMREGDEVKGEVVLREALKESQQPILLYKLGMIYYERQEFDQAKLYFEQARILAPESKTLRFLLEQIEEINGGKF